MSAHRIIPLAIGLGIFVLSANTGPVGISPRPPALVVHEWGTITTHHAPDGTPQGGLNRTDGSDPLPGFVHRYELPPAHARGRIPLIKSPAAPERADVTMRLETPVIYFHVSAGAGDPQRLDVSVHFRGGVLNEFYPAADASVQLDAEPATANAQNSQLTRWDGAILDSSVLGSLRWHGVTLADSISAPRTPAHVWLAPRHVRSAGVVTASGESEHYLFYRGVGHLDALMQTRLTPGDVQLRAPRRAEWMRHTPVALGPVWLVDIHADGRVAFREHTAFSMSAADTSRELARMLLFSDADYSTVALADLRASMKRALVTAGLFDDEANAMLETWSQSYFRTPGLRLFYIVPRDWTDYFLPLQISVPNTLTRVLVGRIDLLPR
jgi:hypothetical protein